MERYMISLNMSIYAVKMSNFLKRTMSFQLNIKVNPKIHKTNYALQVGK